MKIPASLRKLYEDQRPRNEGLRKKVDDRINSLRKRRWHYEARIKELESFALKIESGRIQAPGDLEDFFACTLVVANGAEIADAEALIRTQFRVVERRPPTDAETFKNPESFPFDDLRLYAEWQDDVSLPASGVTGIRFEVQIKTFLQHAWSIATHDLVYKTAEPDWAKQRIAYQIKAMLEHAELSIQEAERLAVSSALAKSSKTSRRIADTVSLLKDLWPPEDLPTNLRGLADNVVVLCTAMRLELEDLKVLLQGETAAGRGVRTRNLSPFAVIVDSLLRQRQADLVRLLSDRTRGSRQKVVIPREVELPAGVDTRAWVNAIVLS